MRIFLADREAELMNVLWEHGPSTVAEVRVRIADDLAYTTVLSLLRTLEAKGYVGHDEAGRAHRYVARINREDARSSALRDLAAKFFEGSTSLLFTHLVSDRHLSEREIESIRRIVRGRRKKREP